MIECIILLGLSSQKWSGSLGETWRWKHHKHVTDLFGGWGGGGLREFYKYILWTYFRTLVTNWYKNEKLNKL